LRIQTYPDHLLLSLPLDTRGYVGLAGWVSESRQGLAALCAKNKQFHQFQGHDSDHIFLALWGKPQTPKVRGTIFTVAYRSYSGNCWAMSFTILESQGAVICRLPGTWFRHVLRMDRESVVEYVEHWWTLMNIDAHWWTCRTIYRLVWLLLDARSNIWCKTHRNHWPKIFLASGGLSPPELCICKTCWVGAQSFLNKQCFVLSSAVSFWENYWHGVAAGAIAGAHWRMSTWASQVIYLFKSAHLSAEYNVEIIVM
jgi:hypothetical protein